MYIKSEFQQLCKDYCGIPINDVGTIDTELVTLVITTVYRVRARVRKSLALKILVSAAD